RWHHVPFGSPGRNRKSTRCLSDLRSRAAFDAACAGRRRLSETSSEEDQETGRDVDRIGWLVSPGPPPRSTYPSLTVNGSTEPFTAAGFGLGRFRAQKYTS